ncbi:MAG: mechanosensitive ion channel family protein [Candidatus Margulisiibacteriota bacterium]
MMNYINEFLTVWTDYRYLIAGAVFLAWLLLGWGLIKLVFTLIHKLTSKTKTKIDDFMLKEAQLPAWFILFVLGFFVVARTVGLPLRLVPYINRFTQLSVSFLILYFIVRLVLNLLGAGGRKNIGLKYMVPTFSRLANIVIWAIGLLMLMDIFGISITPVLASLGIAGLAIGLALQDTLSNFFSGIYVLISQPVRVGDYIELENGLKGYVLNIGWRETRIKMLQNNTVVVPNSKLSQSIITNYYLPEKEMACLVQVGVSYNSDLEKVERVTVEVGKKVLHEVTGGVKTFDPFIRYHTFDDFSINFTVILRISEFVDQYLLTHEFIKALHKRYNKEGIVIPFPIRTVEMKEVKKD